MVFGGWLIYAFTQPESSTLWPVDLAVYRDGGLIVRQLGPYNAKLGAQPFPLYDWTGAGNLNFTYTPFAALFFAAVSFIPWSVLPRIVEVANLIFLFIAAWCTMGGLGYTGRRVRLGGALLGVAAGLLTEPVFRTLYLGQINLLLMAAIIWDLRQPDSPAVEGHRHRDRGRDQAHPARLHPVPAADQEVAGGRGNDRQLRVHDRAWLPDPAPRLEGLVAQRPVHLGRQDRVPGWTGNQSLRAIATRLAGSINAREPCPG